MCENFDGLTSNTNSFEIFTIQLKIQNRNEIMPFRKHNYNRKYLTNTINIF